MVEPTAQEERLGILRLLEYHRFSSQEHFDYSLAALKKNFIARWLLTKFENRIHNWAVTTLLQMKKQIDQNDHLRLTAPNGEQWPDIGPYHLEKPEDT